MPQPGYEGEVYYETNGAAKNCRLLAVDVGVENAPLLLRTLL